MPALAPVTSATCPFNPSGCCDIGSPSIGVALAWWR
jgi:hypothetical protein